MHQTPIEICACVSFLIFILYIYLYLIHYPNQYQIFSMESTDQQLKATVFAAICHHIPSWNQFNHNDITVDRMTGITNQTYKVTAPDHQPIIYRKFGQSKTNVFLDRDAEQVVYKHISEEKQGPKIYGMSKGIRLESFIYSSVLKTEDMLRSEYLQKVAFALRYFHSMKAPQINPSSLFKRIFSNPDSKILDICHQKMKQPIFSEKEKNDIETLKSWVTSNEIKFLQEATEPLEKKPLVFAHNDLLANNILVKDSDNRIVFIDYEYSCFNYRIFDIANYFNETEYDYDIKEEPYFGEIPKTEEKQKMKDRFLRCYCASNTDNFEEYMARVMGSQEISLKEEEMKLYEELKKELVLGCMLSNIMWGWWAIIVCKNPLIQFDYIRFAMKRYNDYVAAKQSGQYKL